MKMSNALFPSQPPVSFTFSLLFIYLFLLCQISAGVQVANTSDIPEIEQLLSEPSSALIERDIKELEQQLE